MMVDAEQVAVESMEEVAAVRLGTAYEEIKTLQANLVADATHIEELENKLVKYAAKHGRATTLIGSLQRTLKVERAGALGCFAQVQALVKVWSFLWDRFLDNTGMELYGDEFQEMGEKAGLLHQVPFDPEKHGEGVEADPGDPIYVLTELGRSCYQKPADEAG